MSCMLMTPTCGFEVVDGIHPNTIVSVEQMADISIDESIKELVVEEIATPKPEPEPKPEEMQLSQEDIDLIALVTMAEAEGESEQGKRLVIDTILNRVDSQYFPDTVYGVVHQPNQFSSMTDGRVTRCYVMDEIVELVKEELISRQNYDVMFFTAGAYGYYGTPMFQVGNHYFCSY